MQLIEQKVPNDYKVYLLGDTHLGVKAHASKAFSSVLKEIEDTPNAYMVFMGDLVEAREFGHSYMDSRSVDNNLLLPIDQYRAFQDKIRPVSKKIITILEGNHDAGASRQYGDMVDVICKDLDIPYGTYASVITFKDKDKAGSQQFKIYVTHGFGQINSTAGDVIRREGYVQESLKRKLKNKMADCVAMFMGHTHKLITAEPRTRLYMVSDGNKLHQAYTKKHGNSRYISEDDRWYGNTGSFMKTNVIGSSGYAEKGGYDPVETGYLVMHIKNREIDRIEKVVV
jgi:predicted phosphodiesterase